MYVCVCAWLTVYAKSMGTSVHREGHTHWKAETKRALFVLPFSRCCIKIKLGAKINVYFYDF